MREAIRRVFAFTRGRPAAPLATPSFESWDALEGSVLGVCHPQWRGVRAAALAFGDPLVEVADAASATEEIVGGAVERGISVLVVHGFPPGSDRLLQAAHRAGIETRVTVHSSMAQHGGEAGEAGIMDRIVELAEAGVVGRIGFVKHGQAEAFRALGVDAVHTPNRAPDLTGVEPRILDVTTSHFGVFAEPFWRKNVPTQLGAVAILGGTAHVMRRPDIGYLAGMSIVEHGELPRGEFLAVQAATDLNLYVTLSECHPMGPIESYLTGVPALMSRTSALFADDPVLWQLTTVEVADDPAAIAEGARLLLQEREHALARARAWIEQADSRAAATWADFTAG